MESFQTQPPESFQAQSTQSPKIRILVCYHKSVKVFANAILRPILCGASNAPQSLIDDLASQANALGVELWRDDNSKKPVLSLSLS